jgi:cytochrome P450
MQDSLTDSLRDFDRQAQTRPGRYLPAHDEDYFRDGGQISVWRALERGRHRPYQPGHLDRPGIYGSANHSALPESLVCRLRRTAQALGHAIRAFGVLGEYLQRRRKEAPGHDLLQILMDARYSDGQGMPDDLILSESMQLLVAGHETSSNGLSWLLYLLSSRPDCVDRIREEFDSVLGDRPLRLFRRSQVRIYELR